MSTDRQRKIAFLARKNEGKKQYPYFLKALSLILKQHLTEENLIDLETTDSLFTRYDSGARADTPEQTARATWPFDPTSQWIRLCFCLAEQFGSEETALFAGPYDTCGALRIRAEYALVNSFSILSFDNDTLRLQSLRSQSGLYLDMFEENGVRRIELKVWGEWYARAVECLSGNP